MASQHFIRLSSRLVRTLACSSLSKISTQTTCNRLLLPSSAVSVHLKSFNFINRSYASEAGQQSQAQIEDKVLDILRNFDRVKENPAKPQVTLQSHLAKDLGLDSLDHVEIIVQLEDAFGYEIPDSEYEKLYTPTEIVKYIQRRLAEI